MWFIWMVSISWLAELLGLIYPQMEETVGRNSAINLFMLPDMPPVVTGQYLLVWVEALPFFLKKI
jgi:hypothetical protein